jgi:Protein of unknown function (DUF2750)
MIWCPDAQEIQAVIALDGERRYWYCIKRVADQEQLWGLRQVDGWALASDDAGRELVPVWPHERFALLCAGATWAGYDAEPIDIAAWLDRWTSGLESDNRLVVVFPTPNNQGIAVEPARFAADLRKELLNYE